MKIGWQRHQPGIVDRSAHRKMIQALKAIIAEGAYVTGDLAGKLASLYPRSVIERFTAARISDLWPRHDSFIFIMAAGIVVRTLAPLIRDKRTDPAVVVLDEKGKFCVSLLSGHLGGANKMAEEIARFLGGDAVITTASDVDNLPSIDLWAREHDLAIENWDAVPRVASRPVGHREAGRRTGER